MSKYFRIWVYVGRILPLYFLDSVSWFSLSPYLIKVSSESVEDLYICPNPDILF